MQLNLKTISLVTIAAALAACNNGSSGSSNSSPTQAIQIVETVPAATNLQLSPAAMPPAVAIGNLIDSAESTIDLEAYYFNNESGTPFAQDIMQNLRSKADQGIKVRIVVEASMATSSLQNGLALLESSPNVQITYNNYFDSINGIVHAKMVIVDNKSFFIGSQNWDWIAFELNHELGGIMTNSTLATQLTQVFNTDFNNDVGYNPNASTPSMPVGNVFVATSPNFTGVPSEIDNIINLINNASSTIDIQAMVIQNFNPYGTPPDYWHVLEDALTNAGKRGVKVNMMMANWEFQQGEMFNFDNQFLQTMESVPNVTIRYSNFPQTIGGVCVPYSAVDHAKFMVVDNKNVWIGTGNLAQSYFTNTRDYSIFVTNNPTFATNITGIFQNVWSSAYMTEFFGPVTAKVQPWCAGN